MTTVYFVRHGEIENPRNIVPMRLPGFHLSVAGREKVGNLAGQFVNRGIAAIYSSPIERCHETAEILALRLGLKVAVDDRLIELSSPFQAMDKNKFEEMLGHQSIYRFPEQMEKGEKPEDVIARMRSFLDQILERHSGQAVIAVSHGDPIMILDYGLTGRDLYTIGEGSAGYIPKASYFEFKFEGERFLGQRLILP